MTRAPVSAPRSACRPRRDPGLLRRRLCAAVLTRLRYVPAAGLWAVLAACVLLGGAGAAAAAEQRCTRDGRICIGTESYTADVCRAIGQSAAEAGLDPHFLARLIWQESGFNPGAVSPAGAQGIAQFMPSTARLVGLDDPFNPARAIHASARYLAKLSRTYGNVGLAAVAYNGGEDRAARYRMGGGPLPTETLNYVRIITGHDAAAWRTGPPAANLSLGGSFHDGCVRLAAGRGIRAFPVPKRGGRSAHDAAKGGKKGTDGAASGTSASAPASAPAKGLGWTVVLAAHADKTAAERLYQRQAAAAGSALSGVSIRRSKGFVPGQPGRVHTVQAALSARSDADRLCRQVRISGGRCVVMKN